jgi:molecular chaperone DnaK
MLIIQGEKNMGIYEELQARGLIAQVTDEDLIKDLRKALEGDDIDEIKSLKDKLQEKAMALATKVYEEAAKAQQGAQEDTDASDDKRDNVQEASYEEK